MNCLAFIVTPQLPDLFRFIVIREKNIDALKIIAITLVAFVFAIGSLLTSRGCSGGCITIVKIIQP